MSAVNSYDLGDERLNADIAAGLADVEVRLAQAVKSDDDFISAAAKHLVDAGGKRFRPLLAVLAANLGDPGCSWGNRLLPSSWNSPPGNPLPR